MKCVNENVFDHLGFDKKPAISVLHQLIRNGNAFLRVKGQREHVSIIGKALKPPKTGNTLGMNLFSSKYNRSFDSNFQVQQNNPIEPYRNMWKLYWVQHHQMLICASHYHVDILMSKFYYHEQRQSMSWLIN